MALLLAALGTVLVLRYVNNADQRAMEGMEPTEILVVVEPIAEGTSGGSLAESVETRGLPESAVGPEPITELSQIEGQVAISDLAPGEQLLASRFAPPEEADQEVGAVEIPEGMHQVAVPVESPRALGGLLSPGDRVGVFISLSGDPTQTHLRLHKVLVTDVRGGIAAPSETSDPADEAAEDGDEPQAPPMPEGSVLVTLALEPPDAERVVFGTEHGSVYFSLEDEEAAENDTEIITPENLYE